MPYRKPKETIDLTGWLAPWEADVYRRRIDDLLDLLSRIRKAVHDALPDKTDPLELDAAIEAVLRENAELRADAELAEEVIVEDDAELLRLRLAQLDLRAENERLRAALEQIYAVSREYAMYDVFRGFDKMQAIAKEALGLQQPTQ